VRDNGAGDFFLMRKRKSIERKETRQQKKYESHERCCLIAVAVVVAAFAYMKYTFTYIHTHIHTYMHACIHTYIHTCCGTPKLRQAAPPPPNIEPKETCYRVKET